MLTTPILFQQVAFDANTDQLFTFRVIGGSQVVSNRLIIKDNITLLTVYDQTQTTFKFEHLLPMGAITNGGNYIAQIQTFDSVGNSSTLSNTIQFYCFESPTITFTNIPLGNIIGNGNFTFEAEYDQSEGELLNTYIFKLYNSAQVEIANSDVKYVNSITPPPTALSHLFAGFEDNGVYYVECLGQTINGTSVTSGLIQFTVNYTKPNVFAVVSLENNCDAGNITISSNIIAIEGTSNPSPPTYISSDAVDLTADGSWVKWAEGFVATDDFTLKIWGKNFNDDEIILNMWNSDLLQVENQITLRYIKDAYLGTVYVELRCTQNGIDGYYIQSEYIAEPLATEQLFIFVRRVGNIFELIIENKGVV